MNRGYHALTTKYNILYNGNLAFDQGLENLVQNYYDNYWEILPVERMQVEERLMESHEPKDPDFQLAEEKATKAIHKHSMYIGGREKNPQMDEAYLLLGKARYYDNRFIPALEAFNYILYKYPGSDKINEAKVWREKTNLRLMYDELAIQNLKEMLKGEKLKGQVQADAYATLAQAYINLEYIDSVEVPLKKARELTKYKEEKARYSFILGQVAGKLDKKEEAVAYFQEVIDMRRKSPRNYIIQAHAHQFANQGLSKTDTVLFLEKYRKLLKDRENRPYLDVINRQLGLFYLNQEKYDKSVSYLKESVSKSQGDERLKARNYIDIGEIYFNTARYEYAGQYFDSAMVLLPDRSHEAYRIAKKRESLHDVVLFEKMAKENDSLLRIISMSEVEKEAYFQEYINRLKTEDFRKLNAELQKSSSSGADFFNMPDFGSAIDQVNATGGVSAQGASGFYFYNQNAVSYGRLEFQKRWGKRALQDNWRRSSSSRSVAEEVEEQVATEDTGTGEGKEQDQDQRYSVEYYLNQLPTDQAEITAMKKDRDFAYFQLGSIYSEKFAEFELGAEKFEDLLTFNPEEKLVLPTLYKLYKIYGSINVSKADALKSRIIVQYPESRYAYSLQNKVMEGKFDETSEQVYVKLYKEYESGNYVEVSRRVEEAMKEFSGDEYLSKFELLKANVSGRLKGVKAYKEALNYVALNYASTPEGKEAERIVAEDIPVLESRSLKLEESDSWKMIYVIPISELDANELLYRKLERYAIDRQYNGIKFSRDFYSEDTVFFVLHGLTSRSNAVSVAAFLEQAAEYKIDAKPMFATSENYAVLQIKKNWDEFLQMQKE